MIERGIRDEICHYGYVKDNKKYIKDYDRKKELSCLKYWDVNSL